MDNYNNFGTLLSTLEILMSKILALRDDLRMTASLPDVIVQVIWYLYRLFSSWFTYGLIFFFFFLWYSFIMWSVWCILFPHRQSRYAFPLWWTIKKLSWLQSLCPNLSYSGSEKRKKTLLGQCSLQSAVSCLLKTNSIMFNITTSLLTPLMTFFHLRRRTVPTLLKQRSWNIWNLQGLSWVFLDSFPGLRPFHWGTTQPHHQAHQWKGFSAWAILCSPPDCQANVLRGLH